jgi:iron complex outermembrane receptor protein
MSSRIQKQLLLSASVLTGALGIVAPAVAQETDEIVVTARRVEETAQDVPISITVFNQDQLNNLNATTANDLALVTPGLTANSRYGSDVANFQIRGAVQESRTTASVATYFADVVSLRGTPASVQAGGDGAGPGQFFDLQNVQVLRGPQGTLFGRNTTGGAVLLVPQRPTDEFGGYIEGSAGDYDMRRAQGVLNVPVSDNLRLRFGLDSMQRDGYITNISGVGPSDFADVDYTAGRVSAVWDVTPNIENYTVLSFAESENNGNAQRLVDRYPGASASNFAAELAPIAAALAGTDVYTVYNLLPDPHQTLESWQLANRTTWSLSDNLELTNIISYGEVTASLRQDPFGGTWAPSPGTFSGFAMAWAIPGGNVGDQYTFTEELRLTGNSFDGRLEWQGGLYYEKSDSLGLTGTASPSNTLYCSNVAAMVCVDNADETPTTTGSMQYQNAETSIENMAAYLQGTYDIIPDLLSTTIGVRYTMDETNSVSNLGIVYFPAANTPALFCLSPGGPFPGGVPLAAGQAAVIAELADNNYCRTTSSQESEAPTYTIGFDFTPSENLLLFAKYTRGYRQGSTNPYGALGFQTYEPEEMDSYEVGAKFDWDGSAPGYLNVSVFQNEIHDAQVTAAAIDFNNGLSPNTFITNGEAETSGFEVEAGIRLFERLHLSAAYGYIDSELTAVTIPGTPSAFCSGALGTPGSTTPPSGLFDCFAPVSAAGRPNVLTPETQYTLNASYDIISSDTMGDLEVGVTYAYVDDQYYTFAQFAVQSAATGGAPGLVPEHEVVNAHINWKGVAGSPIDLSLFGTNILDEEYIQLANERVSSGFNSYMYAAPAMYGVRLRMNFGAD